VHTYPISNKRIISKATAWERRSGATFEGKKTVLIHFTRNGARLSNVTVNIKGQEVQPATEVKLLGVVMDRELRYRNHMALAATKGLKVAMALKRLQMTSPSMARQLFTCMVVLEMVETGNGTVTPVVSNLRIDPALVDGYLPFAHFFPSFFIRMLYLLHSLVKYIYMPIYPRVLVYQEVAPVVDYAMVVWKHACNC